MVVIRLFLLNSLRVPNYIPESNIVSGRGDFDDLCTLQVKNNFREAGYNLVGVRLPSVSLATGLLPGDSVFCEIVSKLFQILFYSYYYYY